MKKAININKKVNKVNIMKNAWTLARNGVKKFGGKVKQYFSFSLRIAWIEAKKAIRVFIPKWFMDKNKNFESTNCKCISSFGLADISKESEKAILVKLPMVTKTGDKVTKFAKAVWIPKAILN